MKTSIEQIHKILNDNFWPETLKTMETYERIHDDCEGKYEGIISVMFDAYGDGYVMIDKGGKFLRFRTNGGGGNSLRVRNALLLLAEAIRLDNEEKPKRVLGKYSPIPDPPSEIDPNVCEQDLVEALQKHCQNSKNQYNELKNNGL